MTVQRSRRSEPAAVAREPSRQLAGAGTRAAKRVVHLVADFVTARADTGADGCDHVAWRGSELPRHRLHCGARHAGTGAAPPSMHRTSGARCDDLPSAAAHNLRPVRPAGAQARWQPRRPLRVGPRRRWRPFHRAAGPEHRARAPADSHQLRRARHPTDSAACVQAIAAGRPVSLDATAVAWW